MKALVTGGSGFVGRALCAALANAGAAPSLAGRQHGCDIALDLAAPAAPVLPGDIDVLFHLGGIAHRSAPAAAHAQVNHRGTVALARAAAEAGVGHFVFLSSVRALGDAPGPAPRDESAVRRGGDAYGLAKYRAERDLAALHEETGLRVTILRPALVYGPGAGGNLEQLRRWVARGRPLPPERGGRSLVAREDLVRLLLQVGRSNGPPLALWHVTDGESYSTRRLGLALSAALGRPRPPRTLPAACWRAGGLLRDLREREAPGSTAAALLGWDRYSADRVRRDSGWAPRRSFEDVAPEIAGAARC